MEAGMMGNIERALQTHRCWRNDDIEPAANSFGALDTAFDTPINTCHFFVDYEYNINARKTINSHNQFILNAINFLFNR